MACLQASAGQLGHYNPRIRIFGFESEREKNKIYGNERRGTSFELVSNGLCRKVTHKGDTHRKRQREKDQCLKCGAIVGRSYLKKHQFAKTCLTAAKTYAPPTPVHACVARE